MTRAVAIDDADDPRIAGFRDIRERDLAGRDGHFVIEGEVVLRTAARGGRFAIDAVLLAQKRVEGFADLIEALPAGTPVYSAGQAVMDAIAGFPIHRGILALGRRAPAPSADALLAALSGPAVVVALFGIGNHDNMGGVFRNAAAFGAGAVLLGSDCCDPLYRKAIRVSVGASLVVPFARVADAASLLDLLAARGFETVALSPSGQQRRCIAVGAIQSGKLDGSPRMVVAHCRVETSTMTRWKMARSAHAATLRRSVDSSHEPLR